MKFECSPSLIYTNKTQFLLKSINWSKMLLITLGGGGVTIFFLSIGVPLNFAIMLLIIQLLINLTGIYLKLMNYNDHVIVDFLEESLTSTKLNINFKEISNIIFHAYSNEAVCSKGFNKITLFFENKEIMNLFKEKVLEVNKIVEIRNF